MVRSSVLFAGLLLPVCGRLPDKGEILSVPRFKPSMSDGHDHGSGSRDGHAVVADVHRHGGSHDVHKDSHDGHGTQGHGHHGGSDSTSQALAVILFGTVGWVMSHFYFVNWPDKDVRQTTWDMLSEIICIFSAVLMFASIRQVMVELAGEQSGDHHHVPDMKTLGLSAVRFLSLVVLSQALFWTTRRTYWRLKYMVSIGAYVVGFAAIDFFGSLLQVPLFGQVVYSVIAFVVMCVVLACIFHLPHLFRLWFAEEQHFHDECSEAEIVSIGVCLGLIVSMLIRFAITGRMPTVHGCPMEKTAAEIGALFVCALLLCPFVMLASVADHNLSSTASRAWRKILQTLKETLSVSVGWCLFFSGSWQFNSATDDQLVGSGGAMKTKILLALMFSAASFAIILVIDAFADHSGPAIEAGFRALLKTFALGVGLSWEASFAEAVLSIGLNFALPTRTFVQVGLTFSLCIVVLPAWGNYILPHTTHCQQKTKEYGASKV